MQSGQFVEALSNRTPNPDLYLHVVDRWALHFSHGRVTKDPHNELDLPPYLPLTKDHVLVVAHDLPNKGIVSQQTLRSDYSLTFEQAARQAFSNLRNLDWGFESFDSAGGAKVYFGEWKDGYASSRLILLSEHLDRMRLNGQPLVVIPDLDHIYVFGDRDHVGFEAAVKALQDAETNPKSLPPTLLRLDAGNKWVAHLPPRGTALHEPFRRLYSRYVVSMYCLQMQMLAGTYPCTSGQVELAIPLFDEHSQLSFVPVPQAPRAVLIPNVDVFCFYPNTEPLPVPAQTAIAKLPHCFATTEYEPELFLLTRYPTRAELNKLKPR